MIARSGARWSWTHTLVASNKQGGGARRRIFQPDSTRPRALQQTQARILDRFEEFFAQRREDLPKISDRTGGEYSIYELASESWLFAVEIGQE